MALSKARPVVSAVQLQDQTGESEDTVLKNESFETGVTVTVTERRDVYEVTVTCNPPRPGAGTRAILGSFHTC